MGPGILILLGLAVLLPILALPLRGRLGTAAEGLTPARTILVSAALWLLALTGVAVARLLAPDLTLSAPFVGVAVTLQAILLLKVLDRPGLPDRLRIGLAGIAFMGAASALAWAWQVARGNPIGWNHTGLAHGDGVRAIAQLGLLLAVLGPLTLGLGLALRLRASRAFALVLLPALTALHVLFGTAVERTQAAHLESVVRPSVLARRDTARSTLVSSRQALEQRDDLPALLEAAFEVEEEDDLAFRLWSITPLARSGRPSALELFGPDGRARGLFALGLPGPRGSDQPDADNLAARHLEPVVLTTLSQRRTLIETRWPVSTDGRTIGAVGVLISEDPGPLPELFPSRLPTLAPERTAAIDDADPLGVVYDRDGRLLWTAHPDPPAPPRGFGPDTVPAGGLWRDAVSGGHPVRLLYFSDGEYLYGVGVHREAGLDGLARLVRLSLFLGLLLAGLLGPAALLASTRRGDRPIATWWGGWRTSHARKLMAALLLASLPPLAGLAILLRSSLATQEEATILALGMQTLAVAERVVRDAATAPGVDTGLVLLPGDQTLYWLSRVIGQELDLYDAGRLVATSRRSLFTAHLLPSLPDAEAWKEVMLGSRPVFTQPAAGRAGAALLHARLDYGGSRPALLSLPLDLQRAEAARHMERARSLTELATVALVLLLLTTSILVGRGMSRRLARLTRAVDGLALGRQRVPIEGGPADELGRLGQAFNEMATTLGAQRAALRARTLTLESILFHAPTGIVSLDQDGRVGLLNPAAGRLLDCAPPPAGSSLSEVLDRSPWRTAVLALLDAPPGDSVIHELESSEGGDTRLRCVIAGLPEPPGARLLVLEDVTEAARSHRLEAWAGMARTIAHEIKNPLTPIRLSAEHLRRVHRAGDPDRDEVLERGVDTILRQVEVLRGLASDFALYARIPALERRRVEPSALLEEIVAPYRDAAPQGLTVRTSIPSNLPALALDERLLRRALVNLIENALHAMPEGGRLDIEATSGADGAAGLTLLVRDTGVGMDAATCARVFEPGFSTRTAGTGLGLAIARRAIEAHGGSIEVTSAPGAGATFTVVLPAAPPAASAPPAPTRT